jgi:PKD repeat protein
MRRLFFHKIIVLMAIFVFLFIPGHLHAQSDLLSENFTETLPGTWTVISANSPEVSWKWITADAFNLGSPFTEGCVIADSNIAGAVDLDEQLITPGFDAGNCVGSIYLEFANRFTYYSYSLEEVGDVDISTDGGATWSNVLRMTGESYGPEMRTLDITSSALGNADVKVRFHYYNARSEFWWLVDDVRIWSTQSRPTADAGNDQSVHQGATVTLDGSGSFDPDQENISYVWTIASAPAGSSAVLVNPESAQPYFDIDAAGDYVISLVVTDTNGNQSLADTVTISTENSPPVASAGNDSTVHVGATVTLDGSSSYDPDGDDLSYAWSLDSKPAQSTAALDNPTAMAPSFVADTVGDYHVSLVVTDSNGIPSAADEVIISTQNSAPIANAGNDQAVYVGDTVTLDGSGSTDSDGDSITYTWSMTSRPSESAAALSDSTAVKPVFDADAPGDYVIRLTVTDSYGAVSAPDEVVVSTDNSPPVADAGEDQTIHVGVPTTLNGSGSDPNGDSISFSWMFTAKPSDSQAVLSDADTPTPSFTPDSPGEYTLALTVTDIWGLSSHMDYVTVSTTNTKPVANAGSDIPIILIGETVYLDGTASDDPDGDDITYEWSLKSAPADSQAGLLDSNTATPYFIPDVYGDYVVELIVSDPWMSSDPDAVVVSFENVKPVADAGEGQSVMAGDFVELDGTGSYDANGDPLTFSWSLSAPADSTASLDDPASVTPSFIADVAGMYTATLVVTDGIENSEPSSVAIEAAESSGDLVSTLQEAIDEIKDLDESCFKNRQRKKTLILKLNVVIKNIDDGHYEGAYNKLRHDILGKMDGCGSSPDKNDWIRCCDGQNQVRLQIQQAMDILEGMI